MDESSPVEYDEEFPYEILSKPNKRLLPTNPSTVICPMKTPNIHGCCTGHH